jgi:general secretion pathway protein E/type IV pilus assembly protein PilB
MAARKRIGDQLIEQGLITSDQLAIALLEQKKNGEPIGKCLIKLGFITEAILRDVLSQTQGKHSIELASALPDIDALKLVPKAVALKYLVLPVSLDTVNRCLILAMTDIYNLTVIDRIKATLEPGIDLQPMLAAESELRQAIDQFYGYELSIDGIIHELETGVFDEAAIENDADHSQPMVRLVNTLLSDAVKKSASDIHFEPEDGFLRLRYRIDGVLRQVRSLHKDYWSAMAVRLKVMSGMDIAETRAPQDGHISLQVGGKTVDFRVAAQPVIHGENIVLRILDKSKGIVPLDKLQFEPQQLATLKLMMARPEGLILVTGPTGSGKTTTLYSMLNHRNSAEVNIMTLENPVEYLIPMIRQTSISENLKLDFASGIRSLMRQDPDIIMVGEIRDEQTAEMAFRAAMTGHQVFSTLHTNSALGVIPRLLDIGVKRDILAGNIIGVLAQRLVRRLCEACKQSYVPDAIEQKLLGVQRFDAQPIFSARGCEQCDASGYKGRMSIIELIMFDDAIDEMIASGASIKELKHYLQKKDIKSLADDGVRLVLAGKTSLEEVGRVTDLTQRLK